MVGERRMLSGDTTNERSSFDQQVGVQCVTISASIVVILAAIAMVALL